MRSRVKRFFKIIDELDAVVIQNGANPFQDKNFFYFTNLRDGLFENATAVMWPGSELEVITYELEAESARGGDFELTVHEERDGFKHVVASLKGSRRIGYNADVLPVKKFHRFRRELKGCKFIDISSELKVLRSIKDETELRNISRACTNVSDIARGLPRLFKKNITETGLASRMVTKMLDGGMTGPSFETLVCFGPNSAVPHHFAGKTKIRKDAFVLCDFGSVYRRYASDITRTWVYGRASRRMRDIYETVQLSQDVAKDECRAGAKGADVHRAVMDILARSGFKGRMPHSTGHSLGLDVHDGDVLHDQVDITLNEGMVFTIEPGVYIKGYGGVRIEDDVVVRKGRPRSLTTAPRELVEVSPR